MPKNEDFDYQGLKTEHAAGWSANDYHNRNGQYAQPKTTKDSISSGFQPVKGMVSARQRRVHNPSQDTIDRTTEAAAKDWRNRGLSNNDIQDY